MITNLLPRKTILGGKIEEKRGLRPGFGGLGARLHKGGCPSAVRGAANLLTQTPMMEKLRNKPARMFAFSRTCLVNEPDRLGAVEY